MTNHEFALLLVVNPVMSEEEKEFRKWLRNCESALENCDADEVAYKAIKYGGFSVGVVCKAISGERGYKRVQHVEGRFAAYWVQFLLSIEEVNKLKEKAAHIPELDLMPLWEDVSAYQTGEAA